MWNLDEQRSMLRDSARSYLGEQQPIAVLRKLRDTHDELGYSPEGWKAFAELGYAGMLVPEAHGGLGLGLTDAALVAEQMATRWPRCLTCPPPCWRPPCWAPAPTRPCRRSGCRASPR